ncbi:hypothetical protein J2X63_001645 [Agromyces sp. 3263]|uniref:TOPRIM nucleotidyl transferase/hydrolase domain-containing protein n=1 Tax=Agromyces sp. 3263 TaxID=2817750 RepID=UPI0028583BE4|nr:TOPRIM nucleotidyl transferase/hydrolase domain-containing protein [Agromyces sp. 3263]MDR6905959.1 hypothetical protein [Agromyces sp. 3263]
MRVAAPVPDATTVVLVEGESDRLAVEAAAARRGVDLTGAGAVVVSMHGVTNLRRHLAELASSRSTGSPRLLGLYDLPEAAYVRDAVADAGLLAGGGPPAEPTTVGPPPELAAAGFFACDPDLEGELIRAVGPARARELLAEHGELGRFRTFQYQPEQRVRSVEAQLRRFMGTHAGRKAKFAPILVSAIDDSRMPPPLSALIGAVLSRV